MAGLLIGKQLLLAGSGGRSSPSGLRSAAWPDACRSADSARPVAEGLRERIEALAVLLQEGGNVAGQPDVPELAT